MTRPYQICTQCVMDTSDSHIFFDEQGVCDHCRNFENTIKPTWHPDEDRMEELMQVAEQIKKAGKGRDYDCILGLSGGADSSYLAYIAKEVMGLRPLAYVVDTGWNLNVAVENIEKIVKGLDLDMYTDVINWKEMADFQLAMFKSGISSQDAPQDQAIFASLYNYAAKHGIKYILTGSNNSTEFVRPPVEFIHMNDYTMYRDIHKKFGKRKLKTYPFCPILKYKIFYRYFLGQRRFYPLDYVVYDKAKAEAFLHEKYGWMKYENKHYENVFTRFFEGYYLPTKFGYDTRRNVCSTQILAGTMTRDEALELLKNNPYDTDQMEQDKEYIAKKLGISVKEFDDIIAGPNKTPYDYKNSIWMLKAGVWVSKLLGMEARNFRF
ncbi:MAG: N-acetyl sugar amidotransferase [Pseudobutyrivibrio sp.]|nr:N-acetyl sugar amidotransferase [Pseudobutyrivibrio sp.]